MGLTKENAQTLMEHFDGDYQIKEFTDRINKNIKEIKDMVEMLSDANSLPSDGILDAIAGKSLFVMNLGNQLKSMKNIKKVASK